PRRRSGADSCRIDWEFAVQVEKQKPIASRSSAASASLRTGASSSIAELKPAAPRTTARHDARLIAAAASAPSRAPTPNDAKRIPKTVALACRVFDAS